MIFDKKIFLCRADKVPIALLNGIRPETCNYSQYIKDYDSLTFTVDRFISIPWIDNGKLKNLQIESNGYEELGVYKLLFLEDIGYFQLQEPIRRFDGYVETKEVTAYAAYKEFEDKNLIGFEVNTGNDGSLERYEENLDELGFAKEYVTFCNEDNHKLSLMHLVLEQLPGWSVGYIDPLIGYNEETQEVARFSFSIDNDNVYSFLTNTVAPYVYCVFDFDYMNYKVNAYSTVNYGKNSNIYIGLRNLLNTFDVTVSEDTIITRFNVSGGEGLNVRLVNYDDPMALNIDYFLSDEYMSPDLVEKVKAWIQYRDDHRDEFISYSKQLSEIDDKISEITYRVPNDGDNYTQWDEMEMDLLEKNLEYYNALITNLQISVDDDPQYEIIDGEKVYKPKTKLDENLNTVVDHDWYLNKLWNLANGYGGYYTYFEVLNYIIPNIEIAIENYELDEDEKKDYILDYETNWDLYGIEELKGLLEKYTGELKALKDYQKPWSELTSDEKAQHAGGEGAYNISHDKYKEISGYIGSETAPGTLKYKLKELQAEVEELNASREEINNNRIQLIESASLTNPNFHISSDELSTIYSLFHDADYSNENIFTTSIDTSSSTIDVQKTLYDDAMKKLYEVSQPQYQFSVGMDNILHIPEFARLKNDADIGNYIYVGIRDDYIVKLRIVHTSCNPIDVNGEFTIEFSNMITSSSGRNDLTYILGEQNSSGKNSYSSGIGSSKDVEEYMTAMLQLMKDSQLFANMVNNAVNSSTIVNGNVYGAISEYLKVIQLDVTNLTGDSASFNELFSKYINTDYITARFSVVDKMFAEEILVDEIHGGSATFTGVLQGVKIVGGDIEADTITANKIILRGDDTSLVYALNNGVLTSEEMSNEDVKNQLHGKNIIAESITATQINVENLWAATGDFLELTTKGLAAISAKIGNWTIEGNDIIGSASSKIVGGIIESVNFSSDDSGVISGCKIDLNTGEILSKNFQIDSYGNATYNGTINGNQIISNTISTDKLVVGLHPNLMPNGLDSFEQYNDAPCELISSSSRYTSIDLDESIHFYGSKSLKLGFSDENSYIRVRIGKTLNESAIEVMEDKKYKISCYVYNDSSSNANVSLVVYRYDDIHADTPSISIVEQTFLIQSKQWTRISMNATSEKRYKYFVLAVETNSNMTYLDAFQVEEIDNLNQEPSPFKPAGTVIINGNNIKAGSIQDVDGNFVINLDLGTITAKKLSINSTKFKLTNDGDITASGATLSGDIYLDNGLYIKGTLAGSQEEGYHKVLYTDPSNQNAIFCDLNLMLGQIDVGNSILSLQEAVTSYHNFIKTGICKIVYSDANIGQNITWNNNEMIVASFTVPTDGVYFIECTNTNTFGGSMGNGVAQCVAWLKLSNYNNSDFYKCRTFDYSGHMSMMTGISAGTYSIVIGMHASRTGGAPGRFGGLYIYRMNA